MKILLNRLDKYITFGTIFLYPLAFLPFFSNGFDVTKLLLLTISVLLISTVKILKIVTQGNFNFRTAKPDLLVLTLLITYLVSAIFIAPNKMDAFLLPGTASFVILGAILYFFINQLDNEDLNSKKAIIVSLILSATIGSIVQLLSFIGVIQGNFTTFGNLISTFVFLLAVLPLGIHEVIKNKKIVEKTFFGISSFIILISGATLFYLMLPGKPTSPNLPSLKSSWVVSVDALKESPILGVGPSNFIYSYAKNRPITANSENNWLDKFIIGRNTPLTIMAETGIIGLIVFITLFLVAINVFKIKDAGDIDKYKLSLSIVLLLSFLYPFSASLLPLIFILLALNNDTKEVGGIFNSRIPLIIISVPFAAVILVGFYASYKAFYADYLFGKALQYVSQNEAIKAYEGINMAVNTNPYVDRYHLAAAEINMAIAQSLAKKENATEEDKKTLAELIQQSIREGKAAVSLDKTKSSSWENLGNIYVSISPFAKDAGDFAIQSYNQAIFLNPIDPNLRIKLGGIYFSQQNLQEAIKTFELAVLAKPDFANSHYNLAIAYKANKQIDKAKEQIEAVLKLVDPNSKDYETAKTELDSLNNIKTEQDSKKTEETQTTESNSTEGLTEPSQSPVPTSQPQIEIPTE